MNALKRVATAVVLIPIVLGLVLRAPIAALAAVAGLVALLAVEELLRLSEAYGIRPLRWPTLIFVALFFLLLGFDVGAGKPLLSTAAFACGAALAATLAAFVFLSIAMRRADLTRAFPAALVSAFAFIYVSLPLAMLVQVRQQWSGAFLVLYLLLVVWAGDVFAYFIGRSLGRAPMSPRISPKKTWEGALASMAASLIVGMLLYNYALPVSSALLNAHLITRENGFFALEKPPLWPALLLSALINIAAQLGDLVESLIKRGAGVKDSGTILPGHGGMLDRVDALLFAAPVLWYYAAWRVIQ
ncbi:MAG: phosphatidate cytidylyltransferase [Acidobacteria bacterium]|nr:MAG: phosphatidate cytidylyltransferase [Acidobacteriota bacterium]